MNKRKVIVPNNLKEYRLKFGYRQIDVAHFLGFQTEERICHWEKGNNIPSLFNLFKLSSLYKATPMELYSGLRDEMEIEIKEGVIKKEFQP